MLGRRGHCGVACSSSSSSGSGDDSNGVADSGTDATTIFQEAGPREMPRSTADLRQAVSWARSTSRACSTRRERRRVGTRRSVRIRIRNRRHACRRHVFASQRIFAGYCALATAGTDAARIDGRRYSRLRASATAASNAAGVTTNSDSSDRPFRMAARPFSSRRRASASEYEFRSVAMK